MANNPKYNGIESVGAGAIAQEQTNPKPTLEGASEYEYVTLTNPLPFTFKGKVAQSRPVNSPIRIVGGREKGVTEETLRGAGLDLRNPDHPSNSHVTNIVEIKSGASINLRGDEAQVIVRQLVNEVLHYNGQTLKIGAPTYRKDIEEQVITGRRSIDDLLDRKSEREMIDEVIAQKNEEIAFPDLEVARAQAKEAEKKTKKEA